MHRFATYYFPLLVLLMNYSYLSAQEPEDALWQKSYDARKEYMEKVVGPFPVDILKMLNMTGVWPGGGLFVIPAVKIDARLAVYTTFGFSNPDMPATVEIVNFELEKSDGRATKAEGTLRAKATRAVVKDGVAGYGYEMLLVTTAGSKWPLSLLQWAVNAELGHDVGFLGRVEEFDGLTVEDVFAGDAGSVNLLITKAEHPLPTGVALPNGKMDVLVMTVITEREMRWAMAHGNAGLVEKLKDAGMGQVSVLERASVVP